MLLLIAAANVYETNIAGNREADVRIRTILATLALGACATSPPDSNWSQLEGCWIDASDAIPPASMVWRAVPDRPGVLGGTWAVNYTGDDPDIVQFNLEPTADGMQLCERLPGTQEACVRAVLYGEHANEGDAVFNVDTETLEFGYADAAAPFYIGRRGGCA